MTITKPKKLAVLGGTFDPVTVGHIDILLMLCALNVFDIILVVPSGYRPDKKSVADPKLIREMVRILIDLVPEEYKDRVILDDRDIGRENTPTVDLMRSLLIDKKYEKYELYFVGGADLFYPNENECQIARLWKRGLVLLHQNDFKFVVVPRDSEGITHPSTYGLDPEKYLVLDKYPRSSASSVVRNKRSTGEEWMHLVQIQSIIEIIIENDLYKGELN